MQAEKVLLPQEEVLAFAFVARKNDCEMEINLICLQPNA